MGNQLATLTTQQVSDLISLLHLFAFLKWSSVILIPILGFIVKLLSSSITELRSMSGSLLKIGSEMGEMKVKLESIEKDLSFTQARIAEGLRCSGDE